MPSTSGMKDRGFYDEHSTAQRATIEFLLDWIEIAARELTLPAAGKPVTIADYGCSEGNNAILGLGRAVEVLQRRGAKHPICGVFSDLATNNFNRLFENLTASHALAADREGFFPVAAGGSFYGPLLPPATVHLGMTFNAVCWMDRLPALVQDFVIHPCGATIRPGVEIPAEVRRAFIEQAASDLLRFYTHRAAEMQAGARLIIVLPGRNEQHWCGSGVYDLLDDACRALVDAGRIDRAVYERITMPVYFRSLDELLAPVREKDAPLASAFTVEKVFDGCVPTPFVEDFKKSGNVERYADAYVGFLQAFSEPVVRHVVEPAHGDATVAAIYEQAKALLRKEPEKYPYRYLLVAATLVRQ
ncbi:MAG: hypothetical protein KF708_04390 [Pirellulales bacterium]|nr:hypothetical protein [Pirellulales bacterium]